MKDRHRIYELIELIELIEYYELIDELDSLIQSCEHLIADESGCKYVVELSLNDVKIICEALECYREMLEQL